MSPSPRSKGSTKQKVGLMSYRTNFYRSVPKTESKGPRGAARMDSPTLVKDGNKFAGGVQQDFARSQSKDSKATAQPAKRAAELKSNFKGGVTVCQSSRRPTGTPPAPLVMPPPLSPRPNPSQEEFVKTQQQAHGADLLRAKRGGEMAAPYTGGLLVASYKGDAIGGAKRGGEMRGAKGGGAFDGGMLGQNEHEQNEQRLTEQKMRSPSRRGAACTVHMHGMLHRALACTMHRAHAHAHMHMHMHMHACAWHVGM